LEFGQSEYVEIDRYCREREITLVRVVLGREAVEFMEKFDPRATRPPPRR